MFRLTGQGMPRFRADGHGDLYVKVRVVLPTDLSEPAREPPPSSSTSTNQPDPRPREPDMQLDRFTQKAQEAIVAAQQTAERLQSPILERHAPGAGGKSMP